MIALDECVNSPFKWRNLASRYWAQSQLPVVKRRPSVTTLQA